MPQHEPWWNDKKYWEKTGFPGDPLTADVEAIVSEAMRRGKEDGKREAWEAIKKFVEEIKPADPGGIKEGSSCEVCWDNGYDAGGKNICIYVINEINAKLSSLSQSSNEKV